jgi:hypothetical protein
MEEPAERQRNRRSDVNRRLGPVRRPDADAWSVRRALGSETRSGADPYTLIGVR